MVDFERERSPSSTSANIQMQSSNVRNLTASLSTAKAATHQVGGFALLNNLDVGVRRSTSLTLVSSSQAGTPSSSSTEHMEATSSPDASNSQPRLSSPVPPTADELARIKAHEATCALSVAEFELSHYLAEPMEAGANIMDLVRYWEVSTANSNGFPH